MRRTQELHCSALLLAIQVWQNNGCFLSRLPKIICSFQEATILAPTLALEASRNSGPVGCTCITGCGFGPGRSLPDCASPCPPGAAAASQRPSGPPAPLGSTSAWPTALLAPPPLAVFLPYLCKERVTTLTKSVKCSSSPRQSHLNLYRILHTWNPPASPQNPKNPILWFPVLAEGLKTLMSFNFPETLEQK